MADWIINYQGTNGDGTQTKARGAGKWKPDNSYAVYTSPYKDGRTCTYNGSVSSSGGSAVIWNTYGVGYIYSLVSCNVVDSGNIRRVDYVVKFDPSFTSPTTLNDISTAVADSVTGTNTGWVNSDLNFSLFVAAPSVTLSASPTSISSGSSSTLTWTVSGSVTSCTASGGWSGSKSTSGGSQSTGALASTTTYSLSCTGPGGTTNVGPITVTVTASAVTLTVTPSVGGTVTSSPTGITCGATCSSTYTSGTVVTLTAVPVSSYWKFSGWSGCDSVLLNICTVTVSGNKTVTPTFVKRSFNYNEF